MPAGSRCNFEADWCGWQRIGIQDFVWARHNGSTPTNFTGPNYDHTYKNSTGYYLYVNMLQENAKFATPATVRTVDFNPPPRVHGNASSRYYNSCAVSIFLWLYFLQVFLILYIFNVLENYWMKLYITRCIEYLLLDFSEFGNTGSSEPEITLLFEEWGYVCGHHVWQQDVLKQTNNTVNRKDGGDVQTLHMASPHAYYRVHNIWQSWSVRYIAESIASA